MSPAWTLFVAALCVAGCSSSATIPPAASVSPSGDAAAVATGRQEPTREEGIDVGETDLWRRAAALSSEGRYAEAVQGFAALAMSHPDNSAVHRGHAWALAQTGDLDAALTAAKRAVETGVDDAGAHYIHGWILVDHGRHADAIGSYRKTLALDPTVPDAHFELGRTLGIVAWQKSERPARVEDAIEHVQHAIRLDPTKANYHDELGNLLGMSWRFEDAVAAMREAVRLAPRNANIWHNLAGQQLNAGYFDEAVVSFERALELDPPRGQHPDFKECLAAARAKRHC